MMLFDVDDEDDFDWDDDDDDDFSWDDEEEEEKEEEKDSTFLPDDDDENGGDFLTNLLTRSTTANYLPIVTDNKKARADITQNSSEDHRYVKRFTKKELEAQLVKDYKYLKDRCKSKMVIKPFFVMKDYPFKKKSSDSDVPREDEKNIDYDYVLVIGRLPKLRGTEQFRGKAYVSGQLVYIPQGNYDIGFQKRHIGLLVKKKYKVIKKSRIRNLLDPLKNVLRNGWNFTVYKEFPRKISDIGL